MTDKTTTETEQATRPKVPLLEDPALNKPPSEEKFYQFTEEQKVWLRAAAEHDLGASRALELTKQHGRAYCICGKPVGYNEPAECPWLLDGGI